MKKQYQVLKNNHRKLIFLFLCLCLITISACEKEKSKSSGQEQSIQGKEKNKNQHIVPLNLTEESFQKVIGWLDNNVIVYLIEQDGESEVFSYNITSAKKKLIYKTESPIKNVVISPDKNSLLIHTAPTTYLAKVLIIDRNGKELLAKEIESFDLTFEWNEYNPNLLFLTVFFEDWSFQVYTVDIKEKEWNPIESSEPFLKWFGKKMVVLQEWDEDGAHLSAPLATYTLNHDKNKKNILNNVFQYDTFDGYLMTISAFKEEAVYSFYNKSLKKISSFKIPQISQYSGWLVPFNDYMNINKTFITFLPYESGSVDQYSKSFKLMEYNLSGKTNIIFEDIENEPIQCSPNGKLCLYGYQFEKVLDIENKKIISFINVK